VSSREGRPRLSDWSYANFSERRQYEVHAGVKARSEPVLSGQDRRRRDVMLEGYYGFLCMHKTEA
jgi:hypothetical protein